MLTTMSLELKKTPQINMYQVGTLYSITINPDDSHQYIDDPDRLDKLRRYWSKHLAKYSWEYNLYAEFSTPNNSKSFPRYHFHGIIMFRTKGQLRRWYNSTYRQLSKVSYFDIDTIADIEYWQSYCQKNQSIMTMIDKESHYISLNPPCTVRDKISRKLISKN